MSDIVERLRSDWNADEWHLFLCQYCDNRATSPNGLNTAALAIADEIERMHERIENDGKLIDGIRAATIEECALIVENLGPGSPWAQQQIAAAIRALQDGQRHDREDTAAAIAAYCEDV